MKLIDLKTLRELENKFSEIIQNDKYDNMDLDMTYLERMNWSAILMGSDPFFPYGEDDEDNSENNYSYEEIKDDDSYEQYDRKDITKSLLSLIGEGVANNAKKAFKLLGSLFPQRVKPGQPESLYKSAKLVKTVTQGDYSAINIPIFVKALKEEGYQSCYAILETLEGHLELEITEEDISKFIDEYNYLYYTLFPKDFSFIILYVSDYSVITGSRDFIEKVFDCTIERAMKSFKDEMTTGWAKEEDGTQNSMEIFYLELYEKYKSHNEKVLRKLGEA